MLSLKPELGHFQNLIINVILRIFRCSFFLYANIYLENKSEPLNTIIIYNINIINNTNIGRVQLGRAVSAMLRCQRWKHNYCLRTWCFLQSHYIHHKHLVFLVGNEIGIGSNIFFYVENGHGIGTKIFYGSETEPEFERLY